MDYLMSHPRVLWLITRELHHSTSQKPASVSTLTLLGHRQRRSLAIQAIQTMRTLFFRPLSSSTLLNATGVTANGDRLGDAAPFKCLIGRKRKALYMFREQARAQSTLLDEKLVVKKEESQDFGEDEIYLDEDEVDFQVFVSWLYHKKLPTDLFASTSNPITLRMSSLYAMAHRLGAKSFKNTLMDMFCHLAKPGKLAVPVSRLLAHPMDLRCTPLHGIYIQHLIRVIHNLDIKPELTYKGLTHDLKAANGNTSPEAAAIFTDIVLAMMETCRNRGVVETWAGWGFHDHDNNQELCYAPECIERRKKLEAEAKSGTVAAGGEANAKDSTK